MKRLYAFSSHAGTFYVCRSARRYFAMFENKLLDFYSHPEKVALAVAIRFNLPHAPGSETKVLRIPADLGEWQKVE